MDPQLAELPLRDIQAAGAPPLWPPAPGWWLLGVVLLVMAGWVALRGLRGYRHWRLRRALRDEVRGLRSRYEASRDQRRFAGEAASLARRLVVHVAGRREAAGLIGSDWAEYLAGAQADADRLRAAQALAEQPYRPDGEVDVGAVTELLEDWAVRSAREVARV